MTDALLQEKPDLEDYFISRSHRLRNQQLMPMHSDHRRLGDQHRSSKRIRTAMTDALLQEKPDLEETWMRGALLGRLGAPEGSHRLRNQQLMPMHSDHRRLGDQHRSSKRSHQ
jgi:hypothetical protein